LLTTKYATFFAIMIMALYQINISNESLTSDTMLNASTPLSFFAYRDMRASIALTIDWGWVLVIGGFVFG
jgi:hypothetical protein